MVIDLYRRLVGPVYFMPDFCRPELLFCTIQLFCITLNIPNRNKAYALA